MACLILNMPFPHRYPFGEKILSSLHIPTRISLEKGALDGFHVLFIFSMIFLVAGLYFLAKSVEKYHVRIIISAFVAVSVIPNMLVNVYQTNFATGIYAVHYNNEGSTCSYEMTDEQKGYAECELQFGNYGQKDVDFEVVFDEELISTNEDLIASLMNADAPYEITLGAQEWKTVKIRTNIDLSGTDVRIYKGEKTGMKTTIRSGGKERDL